MIKKMLTVPPLVAVVLMVCVNCTGKKGMVMQDKQMGMIVEWAPFEVADGVSEEALKRASERVHHEFLTKQKGFVRRELLKGKKKPVG